MSNNCHPPFCPSLSVPVASRLAFEFQSALAALLCLFEGDGSVRVLVVVTGCVCQSNIQCDQWAAHWRLVWRVLMGYTALTAARGANPAAILHTSSSLRSSSSARREHRQYNQ